MMGRGVLPDPIVHHHQLGNGRHALETVTHFPLPVDEVFPYHTWIHRHTFEAVADGARMTDRVDYQLPLHPWSGVALPLVRRQLNRIFVFRGRTIRGLLAGQ